MSVEPDDPLESPDCKSSIETFVIQLDKEFLEAEGRLSNDPLHKLEDFVRNYKLPNCNLNTIISGFRRSDYFSYIRTGKNSLLVPAMVGIGFESKSIIVRLIYYPQTYRFEILNGASVMFRKKL
jgi:hypothetical protein